MLKRWLDEFLSFDLEIAHLPGIENVLPDCLSRLYEANFAREDPVVYALLARGIIAEPPETDADAVVAALPVRRWHDNQFFPFGVEVATQSCW